MMPLHAYLLIACLIAASSQVAAQSRPVAEGSPEGYVESIVVVARKREQSILDVPASLSALSSEAIERRGIQNLVDVGKVVPNMTVTTFGAGTPSSAMPFIRGIGLQDHLLLTDSGVGVYVDGVYLGRQIGQNWSLNNIERIEVLRGPQGTLWGRNSIGGSINIVTRKPDDEPMSRFGLEAGSRSRINASLYHSMLVSEHLALSLSGTFKRRGGIGKFINIPEATNQVGQLRDFSGRFVAHVTPTEQFSLLIAVDGNDGNHGLNPYTTEFLPNRASYNAGLRNSDVSANPYDNNTGQQELTSTTNQAFGIAATATWKIKDSMQTKLIVSSRHSEYQAGLDDDSTFRNFLSFPERGEADQTSVEWQIDGDFASLDFITGLYYFREKGNANQPEATFQEMPSTLEIRQLTGSYAAYGSIGYRLFDKMRLSGGLRYTQDKKNASTALNEGFRTAAASRKWRNLSWNFDATYNLTPHITLYGSIASGYQAGTFPPRPYCLFGDTECFTAGDNITAINYEVGIRGQMADWLWASVSAFQTDYSGLPYQISTTDGGGFSTENVIVDQRSVGLEWEGTIRLASWLSLHSSLGFIDVDVNGPSVAPLTPELTASVSPELSYNTSQGATMTLRLDYSWRGDMFGEPASGDPRRNTEIAGRSLLNFYLGYRTPSKRHEIGLYGRNITDKRYANAVLNTGDYILTILSNDASEFGVQWHISL